MKKLLLAMALTTTAITLNSCSGGGGGGGGGSTSTYGAYQSPYITATQFVNSLNDVDGTTGINASEVTLFEDETVRSTWDSEEWFVIYDGLRGEYKAVSLQYIRSIVYYDYYSNNYAAADEFRNIEEDDMYYGNYDGDAYGEDYEDVSYNSYDGYFYGEVTGYQYEDEVETHDVNLIASEKEELALYNKVSKISYTYKVSLETATSLAKLGDKVEGMLKKGAAQEELTAEDQAALMSDLENITGVTLEEVVAAEFDNQKKDEVMKKISTKMGTTPQQLEDEILPQLLGIQ
ncbi:MAG: hypothetical protein CME63_03790 [Halobacteriovoraceae bacterium]|nr:hypothetical protein [Halobacteriovoraceae bacterium]